MRKLICAAAALLSTAALAQGYDDPMRRTYGSQQVVNDNPHEIALQQCPGVAQFRGQEDMGLGRYAFRYTCGNILASFTVMCQQTAGGLRCR